MRLPTEVERRDLIKALFGESLVNQANTQRFDAYFQHYYSAVCPASTGDAVIELDTPALRSHGDIINCVNLITRNPQISFDAFIQSAVDSKTGGSSSQMEKEHIARITTEVAFAINCSLKEYYAHNLLDNFSHHVKWEGSVSFVTFIQDAFDSVSLPCNKPHQDRSKKQLKAWKLSKRFSIKIRKTNNLLEHLILDPKNMTLKVFHQVSFLRAHLEKTKNEPLDLSFEESLKRGTLPPKLLLETLLTFHDVLYPVASVRDKRSRASLDTMIQKHGFDPESRWIEFVRATPMDMKFDYWGSRLSVLQGFVKKPPPPNALVAWFERHTSERNALTVAIIGLLLAVIFGVLSFIVGLLQLILAYIAYKYPPANV
ncbi:unnamed protein product [Clonostachys rosea f. rosea IK726]|uniref:Uncharacterized protein n=2 Tax=Bionectria ochroleuca TaxID=29856 RepID=A0A0B7KNM6_BIOOC|nr:unnamed protein product [Clonostachys rosea f. rosea IK726]